MTWKPRYKSPGEVRVKTTVSLAITDYNWVVGTHAKGWKGPAYGFSELLEMAIKSVRARQKDLDMAAELERVEKAQEEIKHARQATLIRE